MKFNATITGMGPEALVFLGPEMDPQFVVIFNEDAPAELAELSILHTKSEVNETPAVGDMLKLGKKMYTITAVGDEAAHTIATLGHCTLTFSADSEPYRPGCIMLSRLLQMIFRLERRFRSSERLDRHEKNS